MSTVLIFIWELINQTVREVIGSLIHNRYVLLFSILLAVGLKTYVKSDKLSKALLRRKKISIIASVAFGAFTPLCACGTTAVLIGMLTTALPWGPVMAFLTSSPLMSPDGFILISGVIGIRFAVALTIASLVIGIGSGLITNVIEKKTNFLKNQNRYLNDRHHTSCTCESQAESAGCTCLEKVLTSSCACGTSETKEECSCSQSDEFDVDLRMNSKEGILVNGSQLSYVQENKSDRSLKMLLKTLKVKEFIKGLYELGLKQILLFYSIFIAVGFLINYFIPDSIVTILFGTKSIFAVPLASLIGLPLYVTTGSGVPIIQSMMESGASVGAMLAFMITGSATSAWVIAGLSTFMKKKAILLYVTYVTIGGLLFGYLYDFILFLL